MLDILTVLKDSGISLSGDEIVFRLGNRKDVFYNLGRMWSLGYVYCVNPTDIKTRWGITETGLNFLKEEK